jgi:hypothetical protein
MLSALELSAVVLGDRLGLYQALADGRPRTSSELSRELGLAERYVREWLEQQAVAAVLEVDDVVAEPSRRRYRLPAEHAAALLDPTDPGYSAAALRGVVSLAAELPEVVEVFRTGGGLAWHEVEYDDDESRDANRATFERDLARWIAWAPEVHDRWPTLAAARGGRASRWPAPTRAPMCTVWTRTRTRSSSPGAMRATRGSMTG